MEIRFVHAVLSETEILSGGKTVRGDTEFAEDFFFHDVNPHGGYKIQHVPSNLKGKIVGRDANGQEVVVPPDAKSYLVLGRDLAGFSPLPKAAIQKDLTDSNIKKFLYGIKEAIAENTAHVHFRHVTARQMKRELNVRRLVTPEGN